MLDQTTFSPVRTFQSYIRPTIHPLLTAHCKEVTSIQQEIIDLAPPFPRVWAEFVDWVEESVDDVVLCGWGPFEWWWLRDECKMRRLPQPFTRYIDVMEEASQHFINCNPDANSPHIRLPTAAKWLKLPVDHDALHGALYDAQLAAQILQRVMDVNVMPIPIQVVYSILLRIHPEPLDATRLQAELLQDESHGQFAHIATQFKRRTDKRWSELWFSELVRLGVAEGDGREIRLQEIRLPTALINSHVTLHPQWTGKTQELGYIHRKSVASTVRRPELEARPLPYPTLRDIAARPRT